MKCRRCNGTGEEADIGFLVKLRKRARLSQGRMADLMGISAQYLCDLENGRRSWDTGLLEDFDNALFRAGTGTNRQRATTKHPLKR